MIILDTLLVGGLRFVLEKLAAAVEAERDDDTALREELLAAQMRLELGEIDETEFARIEAELLRRIAIGLALMRLEETIHELARRFRLSPDELNLDLGPLGRLT